MGSRTVVRVIDLPRVIVWDGIVDPVLVEGWFDPLLRLVGGEPELVVVERRDPELLRLRSRRWGAIELRAETVQGGPRGTSTRVLVASAMDDWEERLDRLEGLLRGHAVDWRAVRSAERRAN